MKVVNMGKKYLDWLCEFVCDKRSRRAFSKLLYTLYLTDFDAILDRDENRIVDGLALRPRFLSEQKIDPKMESHIFGEKKCSVLELMVALAIRCEDNLMQNPDIGDRTSKWFWVMLHSLGLDNMTDNTYDENEVSYILHTFITRQYDYDGWGGLFTVQNPRRDMRQVEIWYQMCWYLSETY